MPPKGGTNHAANLTQLLKAFAEAFQASQKQLAKAYDDLASGYQKHDSKLPKTRPRIPFAEWASREIDSPILHRVLEARFELHWDSLKKSEQTRRVQALNALGLEHPGELYLWFGEAAVASRDAWLGLTSIEVTAATLFSEIIAGRAEKFTRPPHYLRTGFTPSEVIAAKKRLSARAQSTKEGIKPEVTKTDRENERGGAESREKRVVEDCSRISDNSNKRIAVTRGGDPEVQGSDICETRRDTAHKEIEAQSRAVPNSELAQPSFRNGNQESPLYDWDAGRSWDSDSEDEDDLNELPAPLFDDEPSTETAMGGNTNTVLGAGLGAAASRMSPGADGASPDDSAIGMDEPERPVVDENEDTGNANKALDQPRPAGKNTPHDRKAFEAPEAPEAESTNTVDALEEFFRTGLARIVRAKERISSHKTDEKTALENCAELKEKMVHLNERLIARAGELLRAADGSEDEWAKYSDGHLLAGQWEKELVEAGGKKRKRADDASTSQSKRAKVESCAEEVAQQVRRASQTLDELEKLCETE